MNEFQIDQPVQAKAAELFAALAHPVRLRIVEELCRQPRTVGAVATEMKIGQSGASQHLAILARAGLVVAERQGTSHVYRVRGPRIGRILELIFEFCQVHQLSTNAPLGAKDE